MQQVKFSPLADITSRMSGTTSSWPLEVKAVYINGVSGTFTWSPDGALSIPFYTVGTVFIEFTIYLIYDAPSQYLPGDPTDSGSELVYWENRLSGFVSISTSIAGFETGLNEINVGSIQIRIDDEWIMLLQQQLIMPNSVIRVYNDGVIVFKGIASRHTVSAYTININIQKRISVLDSECDWGDPAYLNRIDRSVSSVYYNGADIPARFDGYVIPMLFGPATRYEYNDSSQSEIGVSLFSGDPTPPREKGSQRIVRMGDSSIVRIIPTSSNTGIIGRMPNYQNISTDSSDIPIIGTNAFHFYSQEQFIKSTPIAYNNMIEGEACSLFRASDSKTVACRHSEKYTDVLFGPISEFQFGADDYSLDGFTTIRDSDRYIHVVPASVKQSWVRPAVSSGSFTPGNNRFLTISFAGGINLLTEECFIIFTNITGARTPAEVLKFSLEKHGFTVDAASFSALSSEFNVKTLQQVGIDKDIPTLASLIAEINMSLMTLLVFPSDNDIPYLKKIDPDEAPSQTIYEKQISGISFSSEYREQAANVKFNPKYALSDSQKTALYRDIDAPNTNIFASQKTFNIPHILYELNSSVISRWEKITEMYGSPTTTVQFDLVDPSISFEVGDVINIDHSMFKNKIMVLSIEQKPVGRTIQGRYFYVNQD